MCSDAAFDRQDRQLVPRLLIELNARFALAEVIGIVLVCFLLGGELVPSVNEPHYLTRAKRYWDPSFCVGDFFLSSRDAHGVFFASLGWMTQFVSLATTAWIGRLLAWTLLAIGWHQLCRSLILTRGASLLSATIWFTLVQHVHMSGEWLLGGIEGKVFAYGFVLWGLSYFVTGKWNRTWILLGVASAFHVLVGGWTVCLALLATVIPLSDLQQRQRRWNLLRASWPGLVIGGTIALLGLVPALQLNRALPAAVKERAVEIYVFDRLSHHLLVGDFKFPFIIRHLGAIGLFVAIWIPLRKQLAFGRIADIVWGAIGLAIVGAGLELAFGDSLWCARLARYYWFRCSDVFVPGSFRTATES